MMKLIKKEFSKRTNECIRFETEDGNSYIKKDEFGWSILVNGTYEHRGSLEDAFKVMNDERYWI